MINSPVIYRTYKNVFTPGECRQIEEAAHKVERHKGKINYDSSSFDGVEDRELRNSDVFFFGEKWIFEKVQECVVQGNRDGEWNLNITNMEPLQFSEYGKGGYYDWHFDALGYPNGPDTRFPGMIRKLSLSVLMNDAAEYEGGAFEVNAGYKHNIQVTEAVPLEKAGDMVIFPSLVSHRVTPVTNGVRKSLVCWVVGPPYV